jgi:hypothetical protein
LEDLTEALRGVALWLVFLLGRLRLGVMSGFFADVEAGRFENYPIPYLLQHVYEALATIQTIGRDESTLHAVPGQDMRDRVAQTYAAVRERLNVPELLDYSMATGSIRFGADTFSGPTVSTPVRATNTLQHTPVNQAQSGGLYYAALGERYGHLNNKCKHGAACNRVHFEKLPAGTTRAGVIAQLGGLLEGPLRTAILEGIAKNPDLSA